MYDGDFYCSGLLEETVYLAAYSSKNWATPGSNW